MLLLLAEIDVEPKAVLDMAIIQPVDPIDIALGSSEKGNASLPTKERRQ